MSFSKQIPKAKTQFSTAAHQYQAAFERLKKNEPLRLCKGSLVSQNNVAREAGTDPSALRKSRFPLLIAEIQQYVDEHRKCSAPSANQSRQRARAQSRDLRLKIEKLTHQRII